MIVKIVRGGRVIASGRLDGLGAYELDRIATIELLEHQVADEDGDRIYEMSEDGRSWWTWRMRRRHAGLTKEFVEDCSSL